jgi:hypothetical protein
VNLAGGGFWGLFFGSLEETSPERGRRLPCKGGGDFPAKGEETSLERGRRLPWKVGGDFLRRWWRR